MNDTEQAQEIIRRVGGDLLSLEGIINRRRHELDTLLKHHANAGLSDPDQLAKFSAFLKQPWCLQPKGRDAWWVIIPKFIPLQVGWLERSTETYNLFVVDRYATWFGHIPDELRKTLKIPEEIEAYVDEGNLTAVPAVAEQFKEHVGKANDDGTFRIKKGHEFDLIADLIDNGCLPFIPYPPDFEDLRELKANVGSPLLTLREYQVEAWKQFEQDGANGIFWPFGSGKTVIGAYAIARIKGPKLVIVPTLTLKEQWQERIQKWLPWDYRNDVEIETYNAYEKIRNKKYALVLFDECHRLPANTFSRLATIKTKFRLGFSGSPYREDGRTNYIIALTGRPIGMDWNRFWKDRIIKPPHIEVRIVEGWTAKLEITVKELAGFKGRAIVFCDGLDRGKRMANRLGCPFVHGETNNRLAIINAAKICVISRVGDEGLSLPDLERVIEIDFQGGSRRQEAQRVGRLMHSDKPGHHLALMTQAEFDQFERRFLALEEKGMRVTIRSG